MKHNITVIKMQPMPQKVNRAGKGDKPAMGSGMYLEKEQKRKDRKKARR